MKTTTLVIGGLLLACALSVSEQVYAQSSGFKVIVHPDNPTTVLSAKDVSSYLLKKKTRWNEDGFRVTVSPVDLDGSSSTREAFTKAVHGRSVSSIKNYWQRQIFSGREVPPPEVASDAEVITFVKSNRGAIGYVSSRARLDGVKEVTISN